MRVPPPGAQVEGAIVIAGKEYPFSGKIAWARAGEPRVNLRGRVGVTFTEIPDDLKARLT